MNYISNIHILKLVVLKLNTFDINSIAEGGPNLQLGLLTTFLANSFLLPYIQTTGIKQTITEVDTHTGAC